MAFRYSLAIALTLALLLTPVAGALPPRPHAGPSGVVAGRLHPETSDGVIAEVTWDGTDVTGAGSTTSAFVYDAGASAEVVFNFSESVGTPTVENATLSLWFAGVALSTESIRATTVGQVGQATMNWTFGSLVYLTQGAYEVDAELLDRNGSLLFQQPFFVDIRAPYFLGSVILDMALILGVVEALWIRSVVRYRRRHTGRYRYR